MAANSTEILLDKLKSQIEGFTGRRKKIQKYTNILTNGYLLAGPLTVLAIALNLKYPDAFWGIAALGLSTVTVTCLQFLKHFKFQERLRIAISTHAQLRKLSSRIEFEMKHDTENFNPKDYYLNFENILEDANTSWNNQITKTISDIDKTKVKQLES